MVFSVTYYLELRSAITIYYRIYHILFLDNNNTIINAHETLVFKTFKLCTLHKVLHLNTIL